MEQWTGADNRTSQVASLYMDHAASPQEGPFHMHAIAISLLLAVEFWYIDKGRLLPLQQFRASLHWAPHDAYTSCHSKLQIS